MRKLTRAILFLGIAILCAGGAQAAAIVTWTLADLSAGNTSTGATASAGTLVTGMQSGIVARGGGVTLPGTPGSARYNSQSWNETSLANAITVGDFLSISLTAAADSTFSLESISMTLGASGTGATNWALYDGSTSLLSSTGTSLSYTFTGSTYNNLTSYTFRLYGWGGTSATGTFGTSAVSFGGTIASATVVPEPSSVVLLGIGAALLLYRREKKKRKKKWGSGFNI